MKRRRVVLLVGLLLLVALVVMLSPWRYLIKGITLGEPFHDGKPLSYWEARAEYRKVFTLDMHQDGHRERTEAIAVLTRMGKPAVPALIRLLEKSEQWSVRWKAAEALGKTGAAEAVAPLLTVLQDEGQQETTRAAACESLLRIDPARQNTWLVAALKAKRSFVRLTALNHVRDKPGPQFKELIPELLAARADEDDTVRRVAEEMVKAIDPDAAAQAGIK